MGTHSNGLQAANNVFRIILKQLLSESITNGRMNIAHITGYLTDDIELRSFDKTNISTFRLAVNEGKETLFMPVQVWNQEHLRKFLSKGSRALVTGSLKQEQWETKKGEKRSRMVLNARSVEFLDPKEK